MDNLFLTTRDPISGSDGFGPATSGTPLVLVVEDDADTRELLRYFVETTGCHVVVAADGEEAVRMAADLAPDIILMDTGLPGVDGLMATRRIRQFQSRQAVGIIFLSGHAQPQMRDLALAAGGDDYLVKPINLGELQQALAKRLTRSATA
jgi:CheY-like chemotaxis protein